MENKETKKVATKTTKTTKEKAMKTETKKPATKEVAKKEVKNEEKKNVLVKSEGFNELYAEAGIKCYNPECKDVYRIMGGKKGSSLQVRQGKYRIGTTEDDFELVSKSKIEGVECEKGGNLTDSSRPNYVWVATTEALKAVLKVYAQNPFNQVTKTE